MFQLSLTLLAHCLVWVGFAQGHHIITYPGTRGNNFIVNATWPFGMQWSYPCGGLNPTQNRTAWPVSGGGALAVQPGWFTGHQSSLFYVNMGLGANPDNYSIPVLPVFRVRGPSDGPFPGTFCLPNVPLPAGVSPKPGDLASIQVVQAHKHGAPAYSCADIVFTDDSSKVPPLTEQNCFNTSYVAVEHVQILSDAQLAELSPGSTGGSQTQAPTATGTNSGSLQQTSSAPPSSGAVRRATSRFSGVISFLAML